MIGYQRTTQQRGQVEKVLARAQHLDKSDRVLLEQVLDKGLRASDLAIVSGVSVRTMQRRVQRLCRRLTDPQVIYVLRHHEQWERQTARIAMAVWVRGWTLRETAKRLGTTLHHVRQNVNAANALIDMGTRRQQRTR